jgi:serine O-acetyltransferase
MNRIQGPSARHSVKVQLKTYLRIVSMVLTMPMLILFVLTTARPIIIADTERWLRETRTNMHAVPWGLLFLLAVYPEKRTLYYYRITRANVLPILLLPLFKFFYRGCPSLFLHCQEIGPGLFIQHGFSTIVVAESLGENCWINQQVTIGYGKEPYGPTIGHNVRVFAGAKILGGIVIGNNVVVGANAVVVKSVPDNCTVVGVPAYIIKRDGVRVREELTAPDNIPGVLEGESEVMGHNR